MSESTEQTSTTENSGATPAPPVEAAPVTRGEFDTMRQALESMTASLSALATARQEPYNAPATAEAPITESDLAADLAEGKTGRLMTFVNRAIEKVRKEEVEPLRQQGSRSLAAIAKQTAINSGSMPYLDKVKKQVDEAFERLPLEQRTTPEAYKATYQFIVGDKVNDIVKEETEKAIRQGRETNPETQPSTSGGRAVTTTPEGKTAYNQVFDATALAALEEQGSTPDEFARKISKGKHQTAEAYALAAVKGEA